MITPGRLKTGTKWLNQASPGMTLVATAAGTLGDFASYAVPKGTGIVIPGQFVLILQLRDTAPAQLPVTAELYFGIRVPTEPRRTFPLGGSHPYAPWNALSLAAQRDTDNQASLIVNLGVDFLPLIQDEVLALQVYNTSSAAVSTAQTIFYVPYQERGVAELSREIALRKSWIGV